MGATGCHSAWPAISAAWFDDEGSLWPLWSLTTCYFTYVHRNISHSLVHCKLCAMLCLAHADMAHPGHTCIHISGSILHSLQDALAALQQALPATAQRPYTHPLVPGVLVVPGTGPAEALDYSACGEQHGMLFPATLNKCLPMPCEMLQLHRHSCVHTSSNAATKQNMSNGIQ